MASRLLPLGLVIAAVALIALDPIAGDGFTLRPGTLLLLVGAAASVASRKHLAVVVGLALAVFVWAVSLAPGLADISGDRGAGAVAVRLVQFGAQAVAIGAAARLLDTRRSPSGSHPRASRDGSGAARLLGLLVLCAVGAELLAAYSDNTGNLGGIAFAIVFFGALYGAPALLARDLVRRRGWGWPSMLLLFAALGVTQACLIDQSLFSTEYQGYEGWEETREATLIPALGVSAFNAYSFILGHVLYSFGAPVAVAEAWGRERAREPWLGRVGTGVAFLAYFGAAALIVSDPESRSGSPAQLLVSAVVTLTLVVGAVMVGVLGKSSGSDAMKAEHPRLPVWMTLVLALIAALSINMAGETWTGFTVGTTLTCLMGVGILAAARYFDWSARHTAAIGLGFLFARGLLAFTYFPLLGDVSPVPKYLHNTAMLLIVAMAAWLALRPIRAVQRGAKVAEARLGLP